MITSRQWTFFICPNENLKMSLLQIDADDVAVWKYEYETDPNIPEPETIEKVINHRIGYHGATGSATTCYNVEEKGDPNVPKGKI